MQRALGGKSFTTARFAFRLPLSNLVVGRWANQSEYSIVMELIFEVRDAEEGGYCARALGYAIFTEGDTWEELRANVLEATALHFEDAPLSPRLVQLHYVRDELIPLEAA